jgi:hypothetical protein
MQIKLKKMSQNTSLSNNSLFTEMALFSNDNLVNTRNQKHNTGFFEMKNKVFLIKIVV